MNQVDISTALKINVIGGMAQSIAKDYIHSIIQHILHVTNSTHAIHNNKKKKSHAR